MEPFSPELIAQIATKLYRQGAHEHGQTSIPSQVTDGVSSPVPASSVHPSMPLSSWPPNSLPIGQSLPPRMGIPVEHGIPASPGFPTNPGFPTSNSIPSNPTSFHLPIEIAGLSREMPSFGEGARIGSSLPSGSNHPTDVQQDGLVRFVNRVRNPHPARRDQCLDGGAGPNKFNSDQRGLPQTGLSQPLDVEAIRNDFPILKQRIHGHPLAWLDNAATTQKPQIVIDAISQFYATDNSNIHQGAHSLAARATDAYEASRQVVSNFLGAKSSKEIVFVRGTTEAINLVSNTYGLRYLKKGDEILLSTLEHHANIVPWQMIAKRKGAEIRVIPVNDQGEILMDEYLRLLNPRTRIVSLTHASNSLGTLLPIIEMTQMAKRYGARVLIDGAQSVSHIPINVQAIGCDFFAFSGHKIFGPTGVGALYITEELHDVLPPWQGGGNMIKNVTFEKTTYSEAPAKFEAGTPNIADAVGLKAALEYVSRIGLGNIAAHEHGLLHDATQRLAQIPGLRIIGTAREKVSVLSFVLNGRNTEEIGQALDKAGIAVRSGHHCAQPSLRRFGVESTVRPSFSIYNTHDEVNRLVEVVQRIAMGR